MYLKWLISHCPFDADLTIIAIRLVHLGLHLVFAESSENPRTCLFTLIAFVETVLADNLTPLKL